MTDPVTVSADYTLRPSELASVLALLVEARQPRIVWGPPGAAKARIAQQVAADAGREYVDVRALLLDPVDQRGIPWRDESDRTRWAPPAFLPPSDDTGRWLINLEELPSAVPMVQAALYQLVLDRKCGEYELPAGASLIACGNRESDRGVVHRMPTPLASRFVHLEIRVDAADWCAWGAANGIAPEVLFFIQLRPELLHDFDPQSRERAFARPRTWEFASNIVQRRNGLDPAACKIRRHLTVPIGVVDGRAEAVAGDGGRDAATDAGSLPALPRHSIDRSEEAAGPMKRIAMNDIKDIRRQRHDLDPARNQIAVSSALAYACLRGAWKNFSRSAILPSGRHLRLQRGKARQHAVLGSRRRRV